ncbi:aldehyde dehydrogenase family protein [Oceanibium sediminis]|uniref:aldehyde dehydrogenase family protein n=1 Tax=Oceanibium sediminis TaxID=2026339 RepID=UPI001E2A3DFA|nr:aldehyde dehydrogenase family protein [Oceanibium sediminis]
MTVQTPVTTIEVRNPRTGAVDYRFQPTTPAELEQIAIAARAAQVDWLALELEARIAILARWVEKVDAAAPQIIAAVTADTGRHAESLREIGNIGKWITRWSDVARTALAVEPIATGNPDIQSIADYSPYPVLGVISPWNFPLSLSLMDAIPALLAGCAVIIKPSEVTPRFVEPLAATIAEVPELAQVLHYVRGAGELGAALVDQADMICFTGSTATGRKVASRAAARFIPCFTELGGKDPAVILEGADIERATSAIVTGATLATGQQCYSIERIYVHRSLHDAFVARLTEKASALKLALPGPRDGQIGPLTFAPQAEILARHLADARQKGAKIHCGGEIETHDGGLWCAPTVLSGVDHTMAIMTEESFGPLMPIMAFDTVDEAVRLANDSPYGLSGAVFGPEAEAVAVAQRLDLGGISINDAGLAPFFIGDACVAEKTAFKASGLGGSRLGRDSIKRFLRKKALLVNRSTQKSPWWFDA